MPVNRRANPVSGYNVPPSIEGDEKSIRQLYQEFVPDLLPTASELKRDETCLNDVSCSLHCHCKGPGYQCFFCTSLPQLEEKKVLRLHGVQFRNPNLRCIPHPSGGDVTYYHESSEDGDPRVEEDDDDFEGVDVIDDLEDLLVQFFIQNDIVPDNECICHPNHPGTCVPCIINRVRRLEISKRS